MRTSSAAVGGAEGAPVTAPQSPRRGASAIVVGAGPAGLMAAETLAALGCQVAIYDAAPSPARKFLLAGRGGLNLTHSEPLETLLSRYGGAARRLTAAIERFPPSALRAWSESLGEETFVGSSGRVFPKSFKATPLLRAWLRRLETLGIALHARRRLIGVSAGRARFAGPDGEEEVEAGAIVLALGGASWPRLGADGAWTTILQSAGLALAPLRPANCGFAVDWSPAFRERFAGEPLKSIALAHGEARVRGEAMIDAKGLEGGAVYALSARLREAIAAAGPTMLIVDLKPDLAVAALAERLRRKPGQSLSTFLRKAAGLAPVAIGLLRETGEVPEEPTALAARLKALPLRLLAPAPISRAISTAGGVQWDEIDDAFMLKRLPGVFVAGEMIDWEAPTGGYLLQACFSTGRAAGEGAAAWIERG
ncbi:MAG: TIGR03862 family flavoprotein [Hyphomicrobiales bacterium]|nr:TIGR03862 family flavoprotein [Hyphomicrobiales bacterium]